MKAKALKFKTQKVEQLVWICPECHKKIVGSTASQMNYNVETHIEKHYREKKSKVKTKQTNKKDGNTNSNN